MLGCLQTPYQSDGQSLFQCGADSMSRICLLLCGFVPGVGVVMSTSATADRDEQHLEFSSLSPGVRNHLDRLALRTSEPKTSRQRIEFFGNVGTWLLSRTPMTPQEEARRATAVHEEICRTNKIAHAPPVAERVFQKLLAELPQRMRPESFHYSLTVIDEPSWTATTVGGGYVSITKPYLYALLSDESRGEDRLAFVLAEELGHICREHCRLGYRVLVLEEELGTNSDNKRTLGQLKRILRTTATTSGKLVTFAYTQGQQRDAERFALHLCRNAGFRSRSRPRRLASFGAGS